jgi:hypothetical protein
MTVAVSVDQACWYDKSIVIECMGASLTMHPGSTMALALAI